MLASARKTPAPSLHSPAQNSPPATAPLQNKNSATTKSAFCCRSMYFCLPLFTLYFISAVRKWNPKIQNADLPGYSSAIYLMQYGLIWAGGKVLGVLHLTNLYWNWAVYILVLIAPVIFYQLIRNRKVARILF